MLTAPTLATSDDAATSPTPLVESEPATLQIASRALGDIVVSAAWVMHLPQPLGGFPLHRDFALIPAARNGLWWLQSLQDPDLTFLLGDPFIVDADYAFDLGEVERAALRIERESDAFGLTMVTLPSASGSDATANFRAPLVFNLARRLVLQVVSRDDAHSVRRPIDLSAYQPQAIGLRIK